MRIIENNPPQAPAVSILVPVCNTSKYLPECLDSLRAQSLEDIEIICLNDGSTDSSLDILLDYQSQDDRIRVVDKPNAGYGATMNLGISLARGRFVGIVESDDFAEPDMFATLYRFADWHSCDLVKCNYFEHSETGDVEQRPFDAYRYYEVFDPRVDPWVTYELPVIWAALYSRDMLLVNRVRFNETPGASFQDTSFVFQCWASARRAALVPDCLLHYRVDNTASSVKSSKKVFAVCDEYALSEAFLEEDPDRKAAFREILNVLKLGTYKWNYGRISDDSKVEFARRMAEEFARAEAAGSLNKDLFDEWGWKLIHEVIADPEEFVANHPEQISSPDASAAPSEPLRKGASSGLGALRNRVIGAASPLAASLRDRAQAVRARMPERVQARVEETVPPRDRIELSVIICVYNGQDTIARAIESAIQHSSSSDYEVIIVDDASTDGTNEICQSYTNRFPFVHVIRHETNKRLLEARRTGVNAARGFRLTFLDADDFLTQGLVDYCRQLSDDVDLFQMPIQMEGDESCTEERLEAYRQELAAFDEVDVSGPDVMHTLFNGNLARRYVWGKLIRTSVAQAAYDRIPSDAVFFAEDCYANVALGSVAASYVGRNDAPAYHYVIGSGGTHADMADFGKYERFCRESHNVAGLIRQLADREGLWADYAPDINRVLDMMLCSTVDGLKTLLSPDQWPQALDLVASLWDPVRVVSRLAEMHWHTAYEFFGNIAGATCLAEIEGSVQKAVLYCSEKRFDELSRDDGELVETLGLSSAIVTTVAETEEPSCASRNLLQNARLLSPAGYAGRAQAFGDIIRTYDIDTVLYMNWINPALCWDVLLCKLLGVKVFLVTNGSLESFVGEVAAIARTASGFSLCEKVVCLNAADAAFWKAFNSHAVVIEGQDSNAEIDARALMDAHVKCAEGYRTRFDNLQKEYNDLCESDTLMSDLLRRRVLETVAPEGSSRRDAIRKARALASGERR